MLRLALCFTIAATTSCRALPDLERASWAPLTSVCEASLRGVSAPGGGVVWASGSGGTVLRSLDGGGTWEVRAVPGAAGAAAGAPNDLRDIEALDAERAWVISITQPARVLRTEDGGVTWRVVVESQDARSFYDSLALLRGARGALAGVVVFGDPLDGVFEVLRSDDGEAFARVPAEALPPALEGEAAFAASGTCVVAHGARHAWIGTGGARARVLRTDDAGRTWRASEVPVRQGDATTGIYTVAFRDARHGVVLGGAFDDPERGGDNAAWTDDGGATWRAAEVAPAGYRSGAVWLADGALVAVGRAGCSASTDGGRTWASLEAPRGYYAVATDGRDAWAVGADGGVARLAHH